MNTRQVEKSKTILGPETVEMLLQVHKDALWTLENLGVGCKQPEIQRAFQPFEANGNAIVYLKKGRPEMEPYQSILRSKQK